MKIAVISDLHLGTRDRADRFGHTDTGFLKFLDFLEANFERVVLLGDIYETLTSRRPFAQGKALQQARLAHAPITKRFERDCYTYIHGNHDLVAGNLLGAPDSLTLNIDGQRLMFTHGHGFDYASDRVRAVSEWLCFLGGWVLRSGLKPVFQACEWFDRRILTMNADRKDSAFQKWAVNTAIQHDADIIITGHTHQGVCSEHGDRLFMNSGSCADGDFSFLAMDTAKGSYTHHRSW